MPGFSIQESLTFGWNEVKSRFLLFIGLALAITGSDLVAHFFLDSWTKKPFFLPLLLFFVFVLIGLFVRLALIRSVFERLDGREATFESILAEYRHTLPLLIAGFFYIVAVTAGLLLLVVPGIFIAVVFSFFPFLMVDKNLGMANSFKRSFEVTRGYRMKLAFFLFTLIAINVLGFLLFLVGVLITIPLSVAAYAHAYRRLAAQST